MSDRLHDHACLCGCCFDLENERDALRAERDIQHNFYLIAIEQRDKAYEESNQHKHQADALAVALENFINKIKTIHDNPEYRAVWESAQIHRGSYKGPTYIEELKNADDTLKQYRGEGKE